MSSPIVTNLANSFRYLPQRTIEGVLGPKWGPRVEGMIGMSPAPADTGEVYQAPGAPDPNYHQQMLERAAQGFRDRAAQQQAPAKPDITTMRKPLKGK